MLLRVEDRKGSVLLEESGEERITMVYSPGYHKGDKIVFCCNKPGYYELQLEDTMPPAILYVKERAVFPIPFGMRERMCYNPRSFRGKHHLLQVKTVGADGLRIRRNLAYNPYDRKDTTGIWPHASASAETRGEPLFAARNAIDGICANHGHFPYPYQSWGINGDPEAELLIEFGNPVVIDTLCITLRADFPHDSYWEKGTVVFSDGSNRELAFERTDKPQKFSMEGKRSSSLVLKNLIKANEKAKFPALTQLEVWGSNVDLPS